MSRVPSLDDACPPGEYELVRRDGVAVCTECGLTAQAIHWLKVGQEGR